ncbi:MAG: hypothetical protein KKG00_04845 [Bacteroidetes bacterium]|nr:hypothetical protein [Bacteroidota bacterium]
MKRKKRATKHTSELEEKGLLSPLDEIIFTDECETIETPDCETYEAETSLEPSDNWEYEDDLLNPGVKYSADQ